MKKNNLIKAFLCLLTVGFVLLSCNHNVEVNKSQKVNAPVKSDVVAKVSNGILKIMKNDSHLSDAKVMNMLDRSVKRSKISNGQVTLNFTTPNDINRALEDNVHVTRRRPECALNGKDCVYEHTESEDYEHDHWLGWLTWTACNYTWDKYECKVCGDTYTTETHNY